MAIGRDDVRRASGTDMTSEAGDPHGWMFDCEVVRTAGLLRLKAWWVCLRCKTTVRVSSTVTARPHSGDRAYDEMAALSELAVKTNVSRREVHPRCSEVRAVREVMTG